FAADAADLFDGRARQIERAEMLVEVALLEVGASSHVALVVRSSLAREKTKEGRLAGAVRSDDADPIAAPHEQLEPSEELAAAARGAEPLRVEHDVARARRGREPKTQLL